MRQDTQLYRERYKTLASAEQQEAYLDGLLTKLRSAVDAHLCREDGGCLPPSSNESSSRPQQAKPASSELELQILVAELESIRHESAQLFSTLQHENDALRAATATALATTL